MYNKKRVRTSHLPPASARAHSAPVHMRARTSVARNTAHVAHFAWIGQILMGFAQNTVVIVGSRSEQQFWRKRNTVCTPSSHA
jgi:hypothetical protein